MGVLTGFNELDRILEGGLQNGSLYLLAARPAMGKTGFALNIIGNICLKDYRSAVIFSLEMSKKQLVERFLSLEAGLDINKLRKGQLEGDDWDLLIKGAQSMKESKLIIDDTEGISVSQIRNKCIQYKEQNADLSAVFIDYLQLVSTNGSYDSRKEEMYAVANELKQLAKDLDLPIFVLSQLSRFTEQRSDHRPMLADLRDMGGIDKTGDVIMFLYRDGYYDMDTDKKDIAEVIVAKNTLGAVGCLELKYSPQIIKFENI